MFLHFLEPLSIFAAYTLLGESSRSGLSTYSDVFGSCRNHVRADVFYAANEASSVLQHGEANQVSKVETAHAL